MIASDFIDAIGSDFYTGVPDSHLKGLTYELMNRYGIDSKHHIVGANEGNCVGIAAGHYLATGEYPVVYLQNSGLGNIVNPVESLLNDKVYALPMIFVIGWRGEPNVHDEPQHIHQGLVTLDLLNVMDIEYFVIDADTSKQGIIDAMQRFFPLLHQGKSVAFVVRKGGLDSSCKFDADNGYSLIREDAIKTILSVVGDDFVISTTGKISRELFECRDRDGNDHSNDFLTVGSMGHSSSIALGLALQRSSERFWCIDGDGALLMHMGSLATIGSLHPNNLVHIVINNCAHDTVGGIPTVGNSIDFLGIAKSCGYDYVASVSDMIDLDKCLNEIIKLRKLSFLEVKCKCGSRSDLGRPSLSPIENRDLFVSKLRK